MTYTVHSLHFTPTVKLDPPFRPVHNTSPFELRRQTLRIHSV